MRIKFADGWLILPFAGTVPRKIPRRAPLERSSRTVVGPGDVVLTHELIETTSARWRRTWEAREEADYWTVTEVAGWVYASALREGFDGELLKPDRRVKQEPLASNPENNETAVGDSCE